MFSPELKKGSIEMLVLSLVEARPRHGYEIGKLIESRSGGRLTFALPTQAKAALTSEHMLGGPQRLELEAIVFGCAAAAHLVRSLALLAFSGNIFRRPAWTFVTPVRPWTRRTRVRP